MQKLHTNRLSAANNAKLIIDVKWTDCALSELREGRAAFSGSAAASQGGDVIACIADVGTLSGHVTAVQNGTIIIEFWAMAAATAARLSECAARIY
jgi:hypothetical protein